MRQAVVGIIGEGHIGHHQPGNLLFRPLRRRCKWADRGNYLFSSSGPGSILRVVGAAPARSGRDRVKRKAPPGRYRHERARLGAVLYGCAARAHRYRRRRRSDRHGAQAHGDAHGLAELLRLRLHAQPLDLQRISSEPVSSRSATRNRRRSYTRAWPLHRASVAVNRYSTTSTRLPPKKSTARSSRTPTSTSSAGTSRP